MFIRIAWQGRRRPAAEPKTFRRLPVLPRRDSDDLGVPAPDFHRMTRGLFDRHD